MPVYARAGVCVCVWGGGHYAGERGEGGEGGEGPSQHGKKDGGSGTKLKDFVESERLWVGALATDVLLCSPPQDYGVRGELNLPNKSKQTIKRRCVVPFKNALTK